MYIFSKNNNEQDICVLHDIPKTIEYIPGKPAIASFSDGLQCNIGCLSCNNPRCIHFDKEEINCKELKNFPGDQSSDVCPTNAIKWNNELNIPCIDNNNCILCGTCVRRCPVGAIYYDGELKINTQSSTKIIRKVVNDESKILQEKQVNIMSEVRRKGNPIIESDELFIYIYEKLSKIDSHYHNIIARNLLISLGCQAAIRRTGDVYTRMDAIYSSPDECFGAIEVEFGKDTLDASRGILDDIAVLHARYNIDKDINTPVVICLQLPNARQGYWQVVKDIKKVENIRIGTVTIGALMILNWNGSWFMPDDVTYYLDYDNMLLRSSISSQIGRKINISEKLLGILEPIK